MIWQSCYDYIAHSWIIFALLIHPRQWHMREEADDAAVASGGCRFPFWAPAVFGYVWLVRFLCVAFICDCGSPLLFLSLTLIFSYSTSTSYLRAMMAMAFSLLLVRCPFLIVSITFVGHSVLVISLQWLLADPWISLSPMSFGLDCWLFLIVVVLTFDQASYLWDQALRQE